MAEIWWKPDGSLENVPVDERNRFPVALPHPGGELRDRSGSITSGGTAQQAAGVNLGRRYLLIQNKRSATESFWVDFDKLATTDSPSIEISPGVTMFWEETFVPRGVISVIAATTGTKFTIKEGY